ncbi:MAG: D-2-hydroxyacid dehydrogenase [Pseudomonadota bacterium]
MTRVLIPHDFDFRKYHPGRGALPYEATGEKLRDEIRRRAPGLEVDWARSEVETLSAIEDADVLVAYGVRAAMLDRGRHLRWIQAGSAGIDHFFKLSDIAPEGLRRRNIMLTNAAGVTRLVIGEQVLACILMFVRGMPQAIRQQARHHWEIFCADELAGKTVGIVGLGEIGGRVAELCKCFGTYVVATKRNPDSYCGPADEVLPAGELPSLLRRSDFVVIACLLTEQTRGLINARTLALMKASAYLINVGRGEVVDEAALIEALKAGRIAGAALDTFGPQVGRGGIGDLEALSPDSELWSLDNVIITPNHASGTRRIYEHLAELFVRNLMLVEAGHEPPGRIV